MQQGMVADITIFDADKVTDNSDYESGKNGLPSTGIPWVLVNGQIVVKDSKVLDGVFPGQQVRYPIEEKGRFKTLEKEAYLEKILGKEFVDLPDETMEPVRH